MSNVNHPSRERGPRRIGRSVGSAVAVGALAALLGAAPVAAATWTRTTLADTAGLALRDATLRGHDVAVAWQEPGSVTNVRISRNDGISFAAAVSIAGSTRQATTDICDGKLYVAYARDSSDVSHPNLWLIGVTIRSLSGAYLGFSQVSPSEAPGRYPDVACAGGRLFVTWEQKVGSQWHVLVSQALRSSPAFGSGIDLGRVGPNAGHPVVAGVGDRAYVAWPTFAGTVRQHTWGIGTGPGYHLSNLGERQLTAKGAVPRIAAQARRVVVAWYDCGDIRARVSSDRSSHWSSTRTLFTGACGSEFGGVPESVAVDGARMVVAYHFFQGYDTQQERMLSTTNGFASFTDRLAYAGSDLLLLGYAHPSGTAKLSGAVDEGTRLVALRKP